MAKNINIKAESLTGKVTFVGLEGLESLTVSWKSDFCWSGRVRITYCQPEK
jgi:hypothetical protein